MALQLPVNLPVNYTVFNCDFTVNLCVNGPILQLNLTINDEFLGREFNGNYRPQ